MSRDEWDTGIAAAESRLARLDTEDVIAPAGGSLDLTHAERDGLHVTGPDEPPFDADVDPDEAHADPDGDTALVDAFNEAFNARDLDALLDLLAPDVEAPGLGNDRDNVADTLERLWERRPSTALTRGDLDGRPVSVLWEVGDGGGWWAVAPVLFDGLDGLIEVVELADDAETLALVSVDPPDDDLDEGARWEEWAEGAGDD